MCTGKAAGRGVSALAIVVAACGDPSGPDAAQRRAAQQRALRGLDREFAQIARQVSGFGGLSRRSDGSALVLLTDPTRAASARQAIAAKARLFGSIDPSRIDVRVVKFDYLQLIDWRDRLRSLDVPGLVFLDIDESANQLRIGVEPGTSHDVVASEVAKLDIPADAVSVEDTEPIAYMATLQNQIRPTVGGVQIGFIGPNTPPGMYVACTLGFNARFAGSSDTYLVTNSHCSGLQGGVQHTEIFQPSPSPANLIALEHADPDYVEEGCYPHRRCRLGDVSVARYVPGVEATVGAIARTTLRGLTAGSLTIDDGQPTFTITNRQPFAVMGQTLDKVGRTTGWTVGTVVATCIDAFVAGSDVALICQTRVLSGLGGGDSGAPVFESQAPFSNDVTLYGILWGGSNTNFGPSFVFTPLENIEAEFGPMIVTAP